MSLEKGTVHIKANFNNTVVLIKDINMDTISKVSTRNLGFSATKKTSLNTINEVTELAALTAIQHGIKSIDVYCIGCRIGRETAIKTLLTAGLEISTIKDITPIPHNGCRPAKRRRIK